MNMFNSERLQDTRSIDKYHFFCCALAMNNPKGSKKKNSSIYSSIKINEILRMNLTKEVQNIVKLQSTVKINKRRELNK